MLTALFVARLIYINVPKSLRTKVTACVFYNVKKSDNINLENRYRKCLKETMGGIKKD